jgi:serine/threonine-protein kinase
VIFQSWNTGPDGGDLLGIRPGIDTAAITLVASKVEDSYGVVSPDGHWLAYTSNESGPFQVYVVPFPNSGAAKWVVTSSGGTNPVWSHRGNELFYRGSTGDIFVVSVTTKPVFSFGEPKRLFAAPWEEFGFAEGYEVSPDDQRFLMIRKLNPALPEKLIVVENWFEELKAKAN